MNINWNKKVSGNSVDGVKNFIFVSTFLLGIMYSAIGVSHESTIGYEDAGGMIITALFYVLGAWLARQRIRQYPSLKYLFMQAIMLLIALVGVISKIFNFPLNLHVGVVVFLVLSIVYVMFQFGESPQ